MNPFKRGRIGLEGAPRARQPEPVVADDGNVATIRLYDAIDSWGGEWGVSAREFGAALDAVPADTTEIRLLINSPGGEVWDGLAILNQLRAHSARVVAVVEGIAASAASFIAAGCDECVMAANSEMFVHNALGVTMGDADDMRATAADLERLDRNLASIYAKKSGQTVDFWLAEMKRDRFLTAEEAVELGLADRVEGGTDASEAVASARAQFDLSALSARGSARHATITEDHQRAPGARAALPPVSSEPGSSTSEGVTMTPEEIRTRLGLAEDATDEEVGARLDELVAAASNDEEPAGEQEQEPAAAAAALPEGVVAMDAGVLAQLREDAAAGRAAREQQTAERREGYLARALADGRITAATRTHYRALLDKDEAGTLALLESLAPNTAVPVDALGYSDTDREPAADAYPASWKR